MFSDSTVVVPWDFSKHSTCALKFALANTPAKNIKLICVLERPNPYAFGVQWYDNAEEQAREHCQKTFREQFDKTQYPDLEFVSEFGDPAAVIVNFAESQNASAILMSTHGRTGMQRLLLGSVAQKVSQSARCPVVLLPNAWFESHTESSDAEQAAAEPAS